MYITPLCFLSSNIIYFGQKQPIKVQLFEILEYWGQNSSYSSCQFWTDKSIPLHFLHPFFIVMTHNFPVNFKLIPFQLWTKESHQSPSFETFKCSGENLPNSTCHFWKDKSALLQINYQSWLSSNITLLYFLGPSIIYFGQKQLIKVQTFWIFECSGQNLLNALCSFWSDKSFPFQLLHHSLLS